MSKTKTKITTIDLDERSQIIDELHGWVIDTAIGSIDGGGFPFVELHLSDVVSRYQHKIVRFTAEGWEVSGLAVEELPDE